MSSDQTAQKMKRTLFWACFAAVVLSMLPFLLGSLSAAKTGDWFAGFQHSFDDQMVYAAWMTQAQDGHLLMDNRFAVDPQPGLTIHLYYFVAGLVSKVLGIPLTFALARGVFSALFVVLLYGFLRRLSPNTYFQKLGLCLGAFGGGMGFLVWHSFGQDFAKGADGTIARIMDGHLPIDVWQPEAFVFPSMLTNSLFMVSLCLVLVVLSCLLDARKSWKPVVPGALAMLVLMNVHSYDVLLIGLVGIGLLVVQIANRNVSLTWVLRALTIGLGALPSALWFVYVLREDAVFQARAATLTFAPTFKQVAAGLALLIAFSALRWIEERQNDSAKRWRIGLIVAAVLIGVGWFLSAANPNAYWLGWMAWAFAYAAAVAVAVLMRTENCALNLIQTWALVSLAAIYFPGLFQRKLAMGMALPWSILAALGLYALVALKAKEVRIAVGALSLAAMCFTSVCWFLRERAYITSNVARTTVQPVFFQPEVRQILQTLRKEEGRKVILAMPGVPRMTANEYGIEPDSFEAPFIPDLNPMASGFAGAYSYAGHWSETPNYLDRRNDATRFFLRSTTDESRREILARSGAKYLIAPVPEAFPEMFDLTQQALIDARQMGDVLAGGTQFVLVRLR